MIRQGTLKVASTDAHRFELISRLPAQPRASLLWLPALGVSARHYLPLADALAARGIAVFLHEWRGNGSSSLRPSRTQDWGYRELLQYDLPASAMAIARQLPDLPRILGGHSLGGQLACCHAGLAQSEWLALWLVASGTPWWRSFPAPRRYLLPLAYRVLPWLAQRRGVMPGRALGFGGNEARSLIRDWSSVGLSNRYAASGMAVDLEQALRRVDAPATAVVFDSDWLAPVSSTQALLEKMPAATHRLETLSRAQLHAPADHFSWMKSPERVVNVLYDGND
ncbi:alpha/beta fold hydrolase [Stenotrophomonas sp. YIM B06876]|uniref:alpha/beta hydrolase family protein n=1 Tax=Stenotrophomonas sp. YIM B06876 TaxID=3060211 RepID=UPI0027399CE5|nr:alpha/beta fold hydrolase [Stenotrophomonas sp. YIM B06876]